MKLTFIGSGSAFTVGAGNYQSNLFIETEEKKRLLIDCGSDARLALNELNLSYKDIHGVYISHLHADHCGGLEWLAFCSKFDPQSKKPDLYLHHDLIDPLWNTLAAGLNSLQEEHIDLHTYFKVHPIQNLQFSWESLNFAIFQTIHIQLAHGLMPCYGLQAELKGKKIMITSDTQFVPKLLSPLYQESNLIFHDCEISEKKSGVHAHYTDLKTLPLEIKRKMWLYHYQPVPLPDAKSDGFLGFVQRGQCFEFGNLL